MRQVLVLCAVKRRGNAMNSIDFERLTREEIEKLSFETACELAYKDYEDWCVANRQTKNHQRFVDRNSRHYVP